MTKAPASTESSSISLWNTRRELLAFAYDPEVEYHNNRAERHNRPLVISRKNSFGSDTRKGAEHTCIPHSVSKPASSTAEKPSTSCTP